MILGEIIEQIYREKGADAQVLVPWKGQEILTPLADLGYDGAGFPARIHQGFPGGLDTVLVDWHETGRYKPWFKV